MGESAGKRLQETKGPPCCRPDLPFWLSYKRQRSIVGHAQPRGPGCAAEKSRTWTRGRIGPAQNQSLQALGTLASLPSDTRRLFFLTLASMAPRWVPNPISP